MALPPGALACSPNFVPACFIRSLGKSVESFASVYAFTYYRKQTNKTPHTQCQLWDRRTVHTHTGFLPKAARASLGVRGAPRIGPAAVLAPLRSVSYRRGVVGGRRSPRQCPVWCLGFSALVPRHQILKGIAKSALATEKKRSRSWAPALSRPLKMPLNQKPEEQRGTPPFPDRTKSLYRHVTVSGRVAASAEASQLGRKRNITASGVTRLPQAPSSRFPLPASYSSDAATQQFSGPKEGAQDHESRKSHGFQTCQGRLRCQASSRESQLSSQLHL